MGNTYKDPHGMTPQEILAEAERLQTRQDLGASFFYDTIAMSLEGVLIDDANRTGNLGELGEYHQRASDLIHYLWSRIDHDLACRASEAGIAVRPDNRLSLMTKMSPHYRTYQQLVARFQDQELTHKRVHVSA